MKRSKRKNNFRKGRSSKKSFSKTASKTHRKNMGRAQPAMRGGIRL